MFQLLIVDDEPLAVKSVEIGVDWAKHNIGAIFKAYNIRRAKEVFENNSIDIMLCDIEMPQGNGLELLAWVRDNHPGTLSIIFTCHRDFSYAKEAMHLGSFDYILKPISFEELEAVIGKATGKITEDRKILENSRYGELWRKYQPYIIEQFWLDIINGKIPANSGDILKAAAERNIAIGEMELIPFVYDVCRKDENTTDAENCALLTEIKSCMGRMIPLEKLNGTFLSLEDGKVLVLAQYDRENMGEWKEMAEFCRKFLDNYKEMHGRNLICYMGVLCTAAGLAQTVRSLLEMDRNNVTKKSGLFWLDKKIDRQTKMSLSTDHLTILLFKEEFDKFLVELEKDLTSPDNEDKIDAAFLKQFHQNLLQILYSYLNGQNIHVHQNLSDSVSIGLFEKATKSVYDLLAWVKHVISRIREIRLNNDDSLSVIEQVKRYIAFHIDQNLSREDIANYVYLNPDYLARLFKKETGMTLIDYFQDERIKYAKTLLEKTDWGICKIASHMGYSNFSHFARAFREKTGMNPGEYKDSCKSVL